MDCTKYQTLTSEVIGRILMDLAIVDGSSTKWLDQHGAPMEYTEGQTYKIGNRSDTRRRFLEDIQITTDAQRQFFEGIRIFLPDEQGLDVEIPASSINLSPSGLGLHCKERLTADQVVTVIIPRQGRSYAGKARVVHCQSAGNGYRVGVTWLFD